MLTGQPPCFPSNNRAIPEGAVTHPAASGPPIVIMRQGIHSLFARVADFLRRKERQYHLAIVVARGPFIDGPPCHYWTCDQR